MFSTEAAMVVGIPEWAKYAGGVVGGAALYAIGYESAKRIIEAVWRKKTTPRERERVNLSGSWYAVWQTTVEAKEIFNSELLQITQKGDKVVVENLEKSPENVLGGYLWRGECKLYDNDHLLGFYLAKDPNIVSKGTLYFLLNRVGEFMAGKWVGCNYDSEFTWGYGVIAKDKDFAREKMKTILSSNQPTNRSQL